jgi:hypothetical protein
MASGSRSIKALIKDEMVEAGIVREEGQSLSYFSGGREYLVSVTAIDITNWEEEE